MKRKCIILGSIFMFFLAVGIWLNGQKGMNLMSDFWVLKKDGSLIHQDNRILCVDEEDGVFGKSLALPLRAGTF